MFGKITQKTNVRKILRKGKHFKEVTTIEFGDYTRLHPAENLGYL